MLGPKGQQGRCFDDFVDVMSQGPPEETRLALEAGLDTELIDSHRSRELTVLAP